MQIGCGISPTQPYGVAVPAFTPASISGLQLWLDASDASTLFTDSAGTTAAVADGDPVGCWKDKSGNSRNATQSDGTKKPVLKTAIQNNKNVILWDGVNDSMFTQSTGLTAQPFIHFTVWKQIKTSGDRRIIKGNNHCGNFDIYSNYNMYAGNAGMLNMGSVVYTTALAVCIFNGASSQFLLNNNFSFIGNPGSAYPDTWGIGEYTDAGSYNNMQMMEFILYSDIPSNTSILLIKNYLNSKWSIY